MKIYELAYTWYEDYSPTIYAAPDGVDLSEDQWGSLCDSLLPEATDAAIAASKTTHNDGPWITWVGWDSIVRAMGTILESKGWRKFEPIAKSYWGSCIIGERGDDDQLKLSENLLSKLTAHNDSVKESLNKIDDDDERGR